MDFLNRLFYRLKYTMVSFLLGGIVLLIFTSYTVLGVSALLIGFVGYFLFHWLTERTNDKNEYEADENGNAKPNYR